MAGAIKAKVEELTAPISDMNKSIFGIAAASPTKIYNRIKNKIAILLCKIASLMNRLIKNHLKKSLTCYKYQKISKAKFSSNIHALKTSQFQNGR